MSVLKRLTALVFPLRCASCGALLDWYEAVEGVGACLCKDCREKWDAASEERCEVCRERVGSCRCITEELKRARAKELRKLVYYQPKSRDAVQNRVIFHLKNRRDRYTAAWLAGEMHRALEETLQALGKDNFIITYAPRRRSAVRETGTDQGLTLARALAEQTGAPLVKAIRRGFGSKSAQKLLSAEERIQNAKKSFYANRRAEAAVAGKLVVLVDDIVTTGATSAACVRLLRRMGAKEVYCFVVAVDEVGRDGFLLPKDKK